VVAVPIDYNGQKMRVCKFEVLKACEKPIENQALYGRENQSSKDIFELDEEELASCDHDYDTIVQLAREFSDRYEGQALINRISEETYHDEDYSEEVLTEEGMF